MGEEATLLDLAPNHRVFVAEYLKDMNIKAAATRMGVSPATARDWLQRPEVQAFIEGQTRAALGELQVNAERVMVELACIGFANAADFVDWDGATARLIPKRLLRREQLAAIKEVEVTDTAHGQKVKLKLHSKQPALVKIGEQLGMFRQEQPDDDLGSRLEAIRARVIEAERVEEKGQAAAVRRLVQEDRSKGEAKEDEDDDA